MRLRHAEDAAAWQTFVETYAPLVYNFCRSRSLQDADATDVTQEVLLEVSRSMPRFEYQPERGRFRNWLGTLTRRRLAQFFKRRERGGAAQPAADVEEIVAPEADTEWTAAFHARVLEVALQRIRPEFEPRTWQAFERVWRDNLPALEASRELAVPIDAVYVAKSRVLKRLREEILLLAEDLPSGC